MTIKEVGRKKLKIGDIYFDCLCEQNRSKFVYVGKFMNEDYGARCLYFWPIENSGYSKTEDGTVCFVDSPSFFMYEEVE